MTRISQANLAQSSLLYINRHKNDYLKYSNEVASGLKVQNPGDSFFAGTISQYRDLLERLSSHKTRAESVTSSLGYQESILSETNDVLVRAREIAQQAANGTLGSEARALLVNEVWELRSHIVSLANSKYQDKFLFAGVDDDDPPYDATTYDEPSSGPASIRYMYDNTTTEPGNGMTKSVKVSDELTVDVNVPGNTIFDNAIYGLERLGRALAGYNTTLSGNAPTGAGSAFTFPDDLVLQSDAIKSAMDAIEGARKDDIVSQRVNVGSKLRRIETAASLIQTAADDAKTMLSKLQEANIDESATKLTQSQTALQASYTVTSRMLQELSILRYI